MKFQNLSVKRLFGRVAMELVLSMSGITIALFLVTKQIAVLLTGGTLLLCALVGIFVLTQAFGKRLSQFTADLCQTLDHMIAGNEAPQRPEDSETQLARIGHRLARLYQIMQENRRRVDEERQELQTLVSDISHQVKTPVSNLKMATDTLLEKHMTEAERTDFIRGIRSQTDKLDFLFQALVKTSRLETGVIQMDKKPGRLFDTVAQAMSGIVYAAEKKEIAVSVDCPEDLTVSHDSKWTSEALFNLLDNAVKYTPAGGKIAVSVVLWEMYVEIKVADTGKGISESNQAAIFRRFYREEEVHEQQGVGIGLYLAREIVTRQGGYQVQVSCNGIVRDFTVLAHVVANEANTYDWVGSCFYLPSEIYEDFTGNHYVMSYSFDVLQGKEPEMDAFLNEYTNSVEPTMTYKSKSTIMAGVTDIQNIVVSIGGTMAFIIGLIGVLNFANTMLTSIFTRRREFATLQSVGMTGRQLLKMLRREGCAYVLLATAVAVPLSLVGAFQIIRPICKQIWFLNFKLELWPMLLMPILLLLFGLAIPYIAYRLINRQSITERLKAGE